MVVVGQRVVVSLELPPGFGAAGVTHRDHPADEKAFVRLGHLVWPLMRALRKLSRSGFSDKCEGLGPGRIESGQLHDRWPRIATYPRHLALDEVEGMADSDVKWLAEGDA